MFDAANGMSSDYRHTSAIPRFCVECMQKILDFGYFVLSIGWQTDKKQEILKLSCKDMFIWTELSIV